MAVPAIAVGKVTLKPVKAVDVMSLPKSSTMTDLFDFELLYINAPLAVKAAPDHTALANETKEVVPENVGVVDIVKAFPPAV